MLFGCNRETHRGVVYGFSVDYVALFLVQRRFSLPESWGNSLISASKEKIEPHIAVKIITYRLFMLL